MIFFNSVYGQYLPCKMPEEPKIDYHNSEYVLKFVGDNCGELDMILQITQDDKRKEVNLGEKVSKNLDAKIRIIDDSLYVVWNEIKPLEIDTTKMVDPAMNIYPNFLTNISLKQISLDGNIAGKTRELEFQNFYNMKIIDLVETRGNIWLFWQAKSHDTQKDNLIRTKLIDQYFVDNDILVQDRYITAIKKALNIEQNDLFLVFFTMNNGCKESNQKDQCLVNYDTFILGAPKKPNQEFFYDVIFAPNQLIKIGVSPNDIVCKSGLEIFYKDEYSPFCLKPESIPKLIERGWAKND